jgi:pyridoxal phosphate enzyme (YggS family)
MDGSRRPPRGTFVGPMADVAGNIEAVRTRIEAALSRAGRYDGPVAIVAVTKTFSADVVREVIRAGITDIGENRVQELLAKARQVEEPCRWHLVGPLQRNKIRKVVGMAHLLHAIDGETIALAVDRVAGDEGVRPAVLLEVNTSGEASKHGVSREDAVELGYHLASLEYLDWRGLMTIGPLTAGPGATRACFRRLAVLAAELRGRTGLSLPELSMGMSDDFETAVEEGATIVRLGRVIVGERK